MFLGLEVTQRTVLLLPGSYSRFKSAASHLGHPWELHTFYCFLTAASRWILCEKLTLSAPPLGIAWLRAASDHGYASRKDYVKHKIKQALLSNLRVQLASSKVDLRWCKHLQQLKWGWWGVKSTLSFFRCSWPCPSLWDRCGYLRNKKCCFLMILFCGKLRYCTKSPVELLPSASSPTAVTDPWKFHLTCTGCAVITGEYSHHCYQFVERGIKNEDLQPSWNARGFWIQRPGFWGCFVCFIVLICMFKIPFKT